jgi:hypothetical protein
MDQEIWKDIEGFDGRYQISTFGRVRNAEENRLLKLQKQPKDRDKTKRDPNQYYVLVCLCMNGKETTARVHRLVAKAFIPNPNNYPEVNHLDRIKHNNHVSNLEWSNPHEQTSHRFITCKKTSKYTGVSWCKTQEAWKAQIQVKRKKIQLGFHPTEEQARDAYLAALDKYGIVNKYATF